jgi:flagellar motor switch protein FliG
LGGLLVAVVLRTIQFNMTRMRDKYLHTNCLAALANMSSQFQNLHTYVSQRIVSLFNLLARKHSKTLDLIQQQSKQQQQQQQASTTNTSNDDLLNDYVQDLAIIEDVMRMVLEIINSCLTHTLRHNINLIYTLLYNRDIFDNYRTHPSFQDVLQNIDTVSSKSYPTSISWIMIVSFYLGYCIFC